MLSFALCPVQICAWMNAANEALVAQASKFCYEHDRVYLADAEEGK